MKPSRAAKTAFVEAQSELMRAVSKGVVHKNTGSRKVGRLAAQLKKNVGCLKYLPADSLRASSCRPDTATARRRNASSPFPYAR
jgi:hypothetical protein